MEIVRLDFARQIETNGHSSKGNQLKWTEGGNWFKADHMGYEALAEVAVSQLLQKSDLDYFVKYEPVEIHYGDRVLRGCKSADFLNENEELITVDHLYRQYTGKSLTQVLAGYADVAERISFFVDFIEDAAGLRGFGKYLTGQLTIDAFFLNEDRHTNNIAVIYNAQTDRFRLCPYFDHGLSLFSDTTVGFDLKKNWEECLARVEAKPFSRNFDEQLDAAEALFNPVIKLNFTKKDIEQVLEQFSEVYEDAVLSRVRDVLFEQRRKYGYLF